VKEVHGIHSERKVNACFKTRSLSAKVLTANKIAVDIVNEYA
jgi:hypothetical protein